MASVVSLPAFFLINPVDWTFTINAKFNDPRNYSFAPTKLQLHEGIDLRAINGQGDPVTVYAAQRGIVDKTGFSATGYGNYARIRHKWGNEEWVTWYGHLSAVSVQAGQFVLAGQKLGIAGTTGFSTGIHLHLTVQHIGHGLQNYVIDDVVDPLPLIKLDSIPEFDEAWFVTDVTIPDGTVMTPGETFIKTWRVRNTGTRTWHPGYQLGFAGGDQMGAADAVAVINDQIKPGQITNISVRLAAPTNPGTHRSSWMMQNEAGNLFQQELYGEIKIEQQGSGTGTGGTTGTDLASFVADVTIEDGSKIPAGNVFTKTWRLRNAGTTTWNKNYSLRFFQDEQMGAPNSISLTKNVAPGELVEISVQLTAPNTAGRHRSTWKLHNAQGQAFDYYMYAEIQVPEIVVPEQKYSEARYLADVTIPDGTLMQPGEQFVKTWRVRNAGKSTWSTGYELAFFRDEKMGGPDSVPLPPAQPGDVVEISVQLTAPDQAGEFKSTWKCRDAQGKFFEFDLFALIEVENVEEPVKLVDEMMYAADVTIPDGTAVKPGEIFTKTWRVRNTGTTEWKQGYVLAHFSDEIMSAPNTVALPSAKPGEAVDVSIRMVAPNEPGLHRSTWKARNPRNDFFNYHLFTLVDVVDPSGKYDMLRYLRGDGRVYDLHFDWGGGGSQRIQTQIEGERFYHVKWQEWEELWADDRFIYRGTDTSPGNNEVYTLYENGQYGSPWIARYIQVGVPFRRQPLVVFRNKSNGAEIAGRKGIHVTWIMLEKVHSKFTFWNGFELPNVAVLVWLPDAGGKAGTNVLERYYYAENHGLVAWEGELGKSVITNAFKPGEAPDLQREVLSWFNHT